MTDLIPCSKKWICENDLKAVSDALRSDGAASSRLRTEYETAFAGAVGAVYAVAVSSGLSAFHLACLAAGLGQSAEVITAPINLLAGGDSMQLAGAIPVFADIDPLTLNLSPQAVEAAVTGRTSAVIPVHFAGRSCDMPAFREIADRRRLTIIEDASMALGTRTRHETVGACAFSDMAVFSASPSESISLGGGGVITTNRPELAARLRALRERRLSLTARTSDHSEDEWMSELLMFGHDYMPGDLQCALGHSQLTKLDAIVERNRCVAEQYRAGLSAVPEISTPRESTDELAAWSLFPIRLHSARSDARRRAYDRLRAAGVGAELQLAPIYWNDYYRNRRGYGPGLCPNAERFYRDGISLPLHPCLTDDDVEHVINAVKSAVIETGSRPTYVA